MVAEELLFVCTKLERQVERAEPHNGCEQKYHPKHDEYDTQRAGYNTAKVQIGEQSGDHDTDGSISIGHIAFHGKSPCLIGLMFTL
jgi:hypothetical protein